MTAAPAAGPGARTFRRSLAARVVSLLALLLFGAAAAARAAAAEYGAGFLVAVVLALLAAAAAAGAWGDRVTLDDHGVTWRNVLLAGLAGGRGSFGRRRLAWRDVARLGSQQAAVPFLGAPRALFLIPHRGRRMVLDSLEDFDEVARRVEAALSSPTADRPR